MINVCSYSTMPNNGIIIDTTSRSRNWSRQLSPFLLGPVAMYDGIVSKNVENAWQFSKVYEHQLNENGTPNEEWYKWSLNGFNDSYAHRYPMAMGSRPEYSYYDGKKLSYIEARKQIYIPLYTQAVIKTTAFKTLQLLSKNNDIWLKDFDGYDYRRLGMSLDDVLNCGARKMGHAFVLAMLLST